MSNVLDLSSIKNHVSRSAFPLESHIPFSAKSGEILPVWYQFSFPNDKWNFRHQHFTRTQPVNTAAFARFREYFDWYFVPLRLLNKNLPQALMDLASNPVQAQSLLSSKNITMDLPYTTSESLSNALSWLCGHAGVSNRVTNFFGFYVSSLSFKLLRYLRYGNILSPTDNYIDEIGYTTNYNSFYRKSSFSMNILPLLAYQKVYNDHFRFSQWENAQPYTWNVDYYAGGDIFSSITTSDNRISFVNNSNFLSLRYANWHKDRFMGIMPNSQLGDIATIDAAVNVNSNILNRVSVKDSATAGPLRTVTATGQSPLVLSADNNLPSGSGYLAVNLSPGTVQPASFNVLQLRIAEATQRYREISQCNGQDFVSQVEAHWNSKLSKALSDQCSYIGGSSSNLNISEIENTALSDSSAILKGKGIGSGQSSENYQSSEYGIVMLVYHNVPLIDYTISGHPEELLWTSATDLPKPEFDRIGLQTIPFAQFVDVSSMNLQTLQSPMGYLPRFYSSKTSYDQILGAFETTLKSWVITLDPQYLSSWFTGTTSAGKVSYGFFKVNPSVCDSIFAVNADSSVDTDQFLVDLFVDVSVVRSFDYDGMPY